jgi:hypothetical protein
VQQTVHLYACTLSSYSSIKTEQFHRITRAFSDSTSICDLQKHELLVFFQQHRHVEVKQSYSSYSYGNSYTRDADKDLAKRQSGSLVASAVDIQVGVWKANKYITSYSSSRFQLIAPVHRIAVLTSQNVSNTYVNHYGANHHDVPISQADECDAEATTNADVHKFVWEINRVMIPEDSSFASSSDKPYEVYVLPSSQITHTSLSSYKPFVQRQITPHMFVQRDKISDLVHFPVEGLDMGSYIKGEGPHSSALAAPPIYDLYAVSEHSGGLGGGHYTAVCRNDIDGRWFVLNYYYYYY